ncbi:hemolysin family protein [Candidatus Woesearchaeota archaeon]|nr:hemolysin family protein [Candidatus Woesearchaeota archaeon]
MLGTILLLVLAILLSGFFSGSEVALLSITELKARHLADQKLRNAKALLTLKKHPKRMLITILIGNNLVNIGGSAIATKLAIDLFNSAGVGIATGVMTFIILTFGEIAPKTFASRHAQRMALGIAPVILLLMRLFGPVVWLFYYINHGIEKAVPANHDEEPLVTEKELQHIVNVGEEEGQIKPDEKEMIQRIFLFDDTEVKEAMTPRTDMFALSQDLTVSQALPRILRHEYSRVPVYHKKIDKVKGVVLTRHLLEAVSQGKTHLKLKDVAQKALYIPRHKKLDKLLKELQHKKVHMAIVVNEHGGVDGLITIEDILEEIVGDIFDESDDVEHLIRPRGDRQWLVLGKTPIDTINEELSLDLPEVDEYHTIAGLVQHRLGRVPKEGERCTVAGSGVSITVKRTEGPVTVDVILKQRKKA